MKIYKQTSYGKWASTVPKNLDFLMSSQRMNELSSAVAAEQKRENEAV